MGLPERGVPTTPNTFIELMQDFPGSRPVDTLSYESAIERIKGQAALVRPRALNYPAMRRELSSFTRERGMVAETLKDADEIIDRLPQTRSPADTADVLRRANHMYYYSLFEIEDEQQPGRVTDAAYGLHCRFAEVIPSVVPGKDPILETVASAAATVDSPFLYPDTNMHLLRHLRREIHRMAYRGDLGDPATQWIDPWAILTRPEA